MFMSKEQIDRKLSDLLREGSKIRKQCIDALFEDGGSCALGAIYEALTGRQTDEWDVVELEINLHFPEIPDDLLDTISEFNDGDADGYVWSREAIADWLERRGS